MKACAHILGVNIPKVSEAYVEAEILKILSKQSGAKIFTPNPQMLAIADKDPTFKAILNSADLLLPDGVGVLLAARISGASLPARITGIDTAYRILELCEQRGFTVAFLGAQKGVAELAAARLKRDMPKLKIVFTHHGYFKQFPRENAENRSVIKRIGECKPDVLFVCFGTPAQEKWISENSSSLPSVRLFMGLGGALDVWSGNTRRAPKIVQSLGVEWLWRCIGEPRRFVRLATLPTLYSKIIWESIKK